MRMNLLRRVLVLALCAALVMGVAAQGAGAEGVDLWLVTEETAENGMNGAVRAQIDAFCQANPEVSIRMDILPNKEAERAEYLRELRQKIESGAGPDLYLLPTGTVLALDQPLQYTYREIDPIFPDVPAAMAAGSFADVSEYYQRDAGLGVEALNTAVMDAGVPDGARYVLPLRYTVMALYAFDEKLPDAGITPELLDQPVDVIMRQAVEDGNVELARQIRSMGSSAFSDLPGSGKDALTAQQLAPFLKDYQALIALLGGDNAYPSRFDFFDFDAASAAPVYRGVIADALNFLAAARVSGQSVSMHPLRTTAGDTLGLVTYYGAVGSGCEDPELAYEFLRQFLTEDAQWEQGRDMLNAEWPFTPMEGWPVRTVGSVRALWAGAQQSGKLPDLLPTDSDVPLVEMEPDVVRFPVKTGIAALEAQLNDAKNGNAPTDADLTALAEAFLKSYTE